MKLFFQLISAFMIISLIACKRNLNERCCTRLNHRCCCKNASGRQILAYYSNYCVDKGECDIGFICYKRSALLDFLKFLF